MTEGDPYGSDLAYAIVDPFDLGAAIAWTEITLNTSVSITSGQQYAIVIGTNGAVLDDAVEWGQALSDLYAGGSKYISSDGGETWTESSARDLLFRTYAGVTLKEAFETGYDHYMAKQYIYDPYYVAQVFTAESNYTLTKLSLAISKGDGTPGYDTVIISIRNVGAAPGKAQNPTPADGTEGIYIRGIDRLRSFQWKAPS